VDSLPPTIGSTTAATTGANLWLACGPIGKKIKSSDLSRLGSSVATNNNYFQWKFLILRSEIS